MKKARNILCSIIAAFGLIVAFAMPAQADPIPFFGEVTSSSCFSSPFCDPGDDPFGFGDGGTGGIVFGEFELDVSSMLISLTIDIGDFGFVYNPLSPFHSVGVQIVGGNVVGILAQLFSDDFSESLFMDGVPVNGFTAQVGDWSVNGFFTLPPDSGPKTTVPEPGTIALLGIGLLGLGASRRRRTLKN